MDWTDDRVEQLKTLWFEGNSAKEISLHLGVTRNAVIGKVHRLGLGGRHTPAAPRSPAGSSARRARTYVSSVRTLKPLARPAPARRKLAEIVDFPPTAKLLTLNAHSCRWPIGHPDDADFGFCGRLRPANATYCDHHQQLAVRRSSMSAAYIDRLAATR